MSAPRLRSILAATTICLACISCSERPQGEPLEWKEFELTAEQKERRQGLLEEIMPAVENGELAGRPIADYSELIRLADERFELTEFTGYSFSLDGVGDSEDGGKILFLKISDGRITEAEIQLTD